MSLRLFFRLRDSLFRALGIERPSDRYYRKPSVEPTWYPPTPPRAPGDR